MLQGFIVEQSTTLRNYIPSTQADNEAALYEETFARAEGTNQFAREVYEVRIDLYPKERRAEYAATLALTNLSGKPTDTIYLNVDSHTSITTITQQHEPLERLQKKY